MDAKDILSGARNYLADPAKWGQFDYDNDGRCCVYGACFRIGGGQPGSYNDKIATVVTPALTFAVRQITEGRLKSATSFNDAFETTHEAVLRLLDIAIAKAGA